MDGVKCDQCGKVIPQEEPPWEFKGKFYCEKCADEMVEYLESDDDGQSP